MLGFTLNWNHGMTVAVILLAIGGAVFLQKGEISDPLHKVGLGIIALSAVVYLGARIWMLTRGRKP